MTPIVDPEQWVDDVRREFAFVEAFGLRENSVVAEDDRCAVSFASGGPRVTVTWSRREATEWSLGHAAEEEVIYPGELAALHATTLAAFRAAFRRRSAWREPGERDPRAEVEVLASLLRTHGEQVLQGDRADFRRLRELRSVGLSEWVRTDRAAKGLP